MPERVELGARRGPLRHRPIVALGAHAVPVLLRRRLEPDGQRARLQVRPGVRRRHETDDEGIAREDVGEDTGLEAAHVRLAVQLEECLQRQAAFALDQPIEFDVLGAHQLGEALADRRLAGAAQPEQRHRARAASASRARGSPAGPSRRERSRRR